MGDRQPIGEFEQLVLLAVLRIGEGAYGVPIREEIEIRTGRDVSRGAVYATLDRLENKGFLRSRLGEPLGDEPGKSRRYYCVERPGLEAVEEARRALRNMWQGLEPVLGDL